MLAVFAPVVAVDVIVELAIISVAVALILLRRAWVSTFGALLRQLAGAFDSASIKVPVIHVRVGFNWVGDALRWIDRVALRLLGEGITATDSAAKRLWHWTAYLAEQTARVTADLAEATWHRIHQLERWTIPAAINSRLHGLVVELAHLTKRIDHLALHPTEIIRPITRVIDPRIATVERELTLLRQQVARVAAGGLVTVLPAVHAPTAPLTHGIDEIRAKLGKVLRVLTPAGITGLVAAAALNTLDLGWLKCRGVTRAGRELCGLGGLLEVIASDAIDALLVADLCELVAGISFVTAELEPVLLAFVDVEDALIGCRGISRPAALHVPVAPLPPLQIQLALEAA